MVALIVWGALAFNKSSLVDLTGSILKVRTQEGPGGSTMVVVDFRINNPTRVPFVVNSASVIMDPGGGAAPVPSTILSKSDVAQIYQYFPLLKPQFNDVLSTQDRIRPGQITDRMVAATFDAPPSALDARKTLRVTIQEVDGAVVEIAEKK